MQNQTSQAVQAAHELLVWLIPQLDKFPRARRFTLGERLEAGVLAIRGGLLAMYRIAREIYASRLPWDKRKP